MANENIPCTKPELCGVKTHRPGTQALCMKTGSGTQGAASSLGATPLPQVRQLSKGEAMFLNEWVPAMILDAEIDRCAEGIVNDYETDDERQGFEDSLMNRISALGGKVDEECWVAFNAIISNKEMPDRTPAIVNEDGSVDFGNEKVRATKISGLDGIRIEAGERGGAVYIGTPNGDSGTDHALKLITESGMPKGNEANRPEYLSMDIYQTEHGELWIESGAFGGHLYHTPVLVSKLEKGQRHWWQDEADEPEQGEHLEYELMRRLTSNPVTMRYLQQNAPVYYPGVDDRYSIDGSPFTYPTGTY